MKTLTYSDSPFFSNWSQTYFTDLTLDEQISITNDNLGIWEVDSEDELVDKISDNSGWCIKHIDYTSNLPHPLTSYL